MDAHWRNHRTTTDDMVQVIHRCSGEAVWFSRANGYWCLKVDTCIDNAEITWFGAHGMTFEDKAMREAFRMNADRWDVVESRLNGDDDE